MVVQLESLVSPMREFQSCQTGLSSKYEHLEYHLYDHRHQQAMHLVGGVTIYTPSHKQLYLSILTPNKQCMNSMPRVCPYRIYELRT